MHGLNGHAHMHHVVHAWYELQPPQHNSAGCVSVPIKPVEHLDAATYADQSKCTLAVTVYYMQKIVYTLYIYMYAPILTLQ